MAKYTIDHRCGHTSTRELFGKTSERERKVEYFATQDCPQCWGAKKRAEEDASPIVAKIQMNGMDTIDGKLAVEVVLTGGTRARKEEIAAAGYQFRQVRGGVLNFLSAEKPELAWVKMLPIDDLHTIDAEIKALDAKIVNNIGLLDIEAAQEHQRVLAEEKKTKEEKIAAAGPKPERPEFHPNNFGKWNGKYYGKAGNWNYYVNNVCHKLTDEQHAALVQYSEKIAAYNAAIA